MDRSVGGRVVVVVAAVVVRSIEVPFVSFRDLYLYLR